MTSCAFFSVAGEIGLNSELCSQMVPWNSCRIVVRSLVAGVLAIKQILVLSLFISMALRGSLKLFGLPRWFSGKESACQCKRRVQSLGREDPLEDEMATHTSILA